MIRAIALDDEPPALRVLELFCGRLDYLRLEGTFSKTSEARQYLQSTPVDLLFLDINMPAISGIDFYQMLPQEVMVIFTTAYAEFAVEGFNLNAVDYLLKPYTFERFTQGVQKARDYHTYLRPGTSEAPKPNYLLIRADYGLHKIAFADILLVEGLDDYLKIHLRESRPIVARLTLKALLEKLPGEAFLRVHRSFIVPLARIDRVRNKTIYLGVLKVPISASYEDAFFRRFNA